MEYQNYLDSLGKKLEQLEQENNLNKEFEI